jgi:hypothetical protein
MSIRASSIPGVSRSMMNREKPWSRPTRSPVGAVLAISNM